METERGFCMKDDDQLSDQLDRVIDGLQEVKKLNERLSFIAKQLNILQLNYLVQNLTSPRTVIWLNFLGGLSRGLGLTLGTAIILGILAYLAGKFINLPVIGKYISDLIDWINTYRSYR